MAIKKVNLRSISLPTRLPSTSNQSGKDVTTFCTNSEEIQSGLVKLAQVYNSVLQLSASQQSLPLLQQHVDESVELIDTCNAIKEMFQMVKENVQSLQSAIRRKGLHSVQENVSSYLCFRKKMNNTLLKSLKTIKGLDKKSEAAMFTINDQDKFIGALREATEYSVAIFRGIITYLSCQNIKSGGWNLISRLVITKSHTCSNAVSVNEVECVDLALGAKTLDGQMVNRSLQNLDSCIGGFEEGLEILFREMIRCRVSILNILNDH